MTVRHLFAAAIVFSCVGLTFSANAQQQPQPLPQPLPNNTGTTTTARTGPPVFTTFPVSATRYHTWVTWVVNSAQKSAGKGPVTQGDVNKITLRVKDCATRVEADGYVTFAEFEYCADVFDNTMSEIVLEHRLNYH